MFHKLKRIIATVLCTVLLLSNITVLHAETIPDGGQIGVGGQGEWNTAGIMVKLDFYNPSRYGLTGDNYAETMRAIVGSYPAQSLSDATLFWRGSGYMNKSTMLSPWFAPGGLDSKDLAQMYIYGHFGYRPLSFMADKNYFTTFESTGHYGISPLDMNGTLGKPYRNSNSILSVNNIYMKKLLSVTENGTKWDGDVIASTIQELWNEYVNPSGPNVNSAEAIRYRQEFASMFMEDDSRVSNWPDAANYIAEVLLAQIQEGQVPPGANFTIETEEQAGIINNLLMATLGLVLGNPAGGTAINPQGVISASDSYKGDMILRQLQTWARSGGNSDASDFHFSFKLEVYGLRGMREGTNIAVRWDQALDASTNQGQLELFSMAARYSLKENAHGINRYGFDRKFDLNVNGAEYNRILLQSIIDAHKDRSASISRNGSYDDGSVWELFQKPYLNTDGTIMNTNDPGYSYRSIVQMTSPIYHRGNQTVSLGYGFISPLAPFKGINIGSAARPNLLMDSTVFSDVQEIPKDTKAKATSYTGYKWTEPYSDSIKDEYGLKFEKVDWEHPSAELDSMLKLIERASDSSQILSGAENSLLPVTFTIRRTITNGKGNADGKILDDLFDGSTIIKTCGQHNFIVESDDGNTATIKFNIIPSGGQCSYADSEYKFVSPLKTAAGKTGIDSYTTINNCAVATLLQSASSRIKFLDDNIEITDTPGGVTTVNYDFSMSMKTPTFNLNEKAYGDNKTDLMMSKSMYTALGYSHLPEDGTVYPNSDWTAGYYRSPTIRRSINFTRAPETPNYTNFGYEKKTPYYAEIKQGGPTNEPFEAMSGTPTTRDLYVSVSGTDFRIDFNAGATAKTNPATERVFTYTVEVSECTGNPEPKECAGSCGSCGNPCPGHPGPEDSTITHSNHKDHTIQHPESHTWIYNVHVPIEAFTYFDMENSEVWRLTEWGLKGGDEFLDSPDPNYTMGTKFWGYNQKDYSNMNGRLIFSEAMNSNVESNNAKFGNNNRTFKVTGSAGEADALEKALAEVNGAKNAERTMKATIVSDYIVLKTSEGYQVPYFFTQEMDMVATPSTAPDFTAKGGDSTTTDKLKVNKQLTMDELWWKNSSKVTCASQNNGWHNTSITYGGYNGDYANLDSKYTNKEHDAYMSNDNPLEKALTNYGLTLAQDYPSQKRDGPGNTTMGRDAGNKDHIKTGLDIVDTTPNGEYGTGKAWLRYDRVMFYQKNLDKGEKSSTTGKFDMTGAGTWENKNVPYFDGAEKINDIVIHNPVSAEYAIVISNDPKYDDRTNAKLMQGGDPLGLMGGVCPILGCQFSELVCTTSLTPHKDFCWTNTTDVVMHTGGFNTHNHTTDCYHTHTDICNPIEYEWLWSDESCNYDGQRAWTLSNTIPPPNPDGHDCTVWRLTGNTRPYAGGSTETKTGRVEYEMGAGTDFYTFTATDDGSVKFYSTNYGKDPRGRVYINGSSKVDNDDDGNGSWNFNCGTVAFSKGDVVRLNVYNYSDTLASWADVVAEITQIGPSCGYEEGDLVCTNIPNKHTCTDACTTTYKKILVCSDPHHYTPGEPTDQNSPKYHYPLGDPRCWKRCGVDANHGTPPVIDLPDGGTAKMGGTFINLDREFKIYYPFKGDFAERPSIEGISETTDTRGKGYINDMNTFEWTEHRWVYFPVNVIDHKGNMRLAYTQIDLNEFSTTDEMFTFYCVLANDEMAKGGVKFTSVAINAPTNNKDNYFDESVDVTNKERVDWKYAARHTASKLHYIDVVGYIGALTIHDTGDFRFSNLFKQAKEDGTFLIPNLVPEVHLNRPNFVVSDKITSRRDEISKSTRWLDTYGKMFNSEGGKAGGDGNAKQPFILPLVPKYNTIQPLRNQPMRPGYQLYMDTETIGNYYGETMDEESSKFLDNRMMQKMQIRPMYYSFDLKTGKYLPIDVYYGVNGEYMQVNTYDYGNVDTDAVGVQDYYYYLDWLNESARRNHTNAEKSATIDVQEYRKDMKYGVDQLNVRVPNSERDVIGSANVLFLNDLNRNFIGSSFTYGVDMNPGNRIDERWYNMQSQRWHFTLGLPSSSVFVESGEPCTETNIYKLQTKDRVIVCTLDIKVLGEVWTLQYNGKSLNNDGFQIFENGPTYQPPKFDEDGNPTSDPEKDVTSDDPIVVIYPSNKTSKDDVTSEGIQ